MVYAQLKYKNIKTMANTNPKTSTLNNTGELQMSTNKFFRCKDNPRILYERLYAFKCEENNKNYIIYTDNQLDSNGFIRVLVGSYNPGDTVLDILPIETETEWEIIEKEWEKQLYSDPT